MAKNGVAESETDSIWGERERLFADALVAAGADREFAQKEAAPRIAACRAEKDPERAWAAYFEAEGGVMELHLDRVVGAEGMNLIVNRRAMPIAKLAAGVVMQITGSPDYDPTVGHEPVRKKKRGR